MAEAGRLTFVICVNPVAGPRKQCCGGRGSGQLADEVERGVRERRLNVAVERVWCLNNCYRGPSMRIAGGRFFFQVDASDLPSILDTLEQQAGRRAPAMGPLDAFPGG